VDRLRVNVEKLRLPLASQRSPSTQGP
jgi:hypothetical protein